MSYGRGRQQVVVVQSSDKVPHLSATSSGADTRKKRRPSARHKQSRVATLPADLVKFTWKYRWRLTPAVATTAVFVGTAVAPGYTLAGALIAGSVAYALAQAELTFRGRKLLSKQERLLVSYWCAGAAGADLIELLTDTWAWRRVLFTLGAATSYQSYLWVAGRRSTRPASKLSAQGKRYLSLWARVSQYSEGTLKGSSVVSGTATEPTTGTLVFTVQLRADVHGRTAETEVVWRKVETLLGLPPDTVRIKCDRDVSTRAKVTMSASKYLEHNVVPWPGPELTPDGHVLLGDDLAGAVVVVPRYDAKGVKHARITGNTGNGKTSTARVFLTACASATVSASETTASGLANASLEECIWLLDGKRGTSLPEVRNLFDWYAVTDDEWPGVLDAFYATLLARQLRRGEEGLSAWRPGTETDPIIRLYIAEASAVRRSLQARGLAKKYDRYVLEALQHGRALGMAVDQESQDATAENWLGGRPARELMSKGAAISHRPGGATGQQYAGDGASERMRLLKLPEQEGFAAVVVNGRSVADVMRVRWCSEDASKAWASTYVARTLAGADERAAGPAYAGRTHGRKGHDTVVGEVISVLDEAVGDTSATVQSSPMSLTRAPARVEAPSLTGLDWTGPAGDDDTEDVEDVEHLADNRDWVLKILLFNRPGLTAAELVERGDGKRGRGRSSIFAHLAWLLENDLIGKDGDVYFAVRKDKTP